MNSINGVFVAHKRITNNSALFTGQASISLATKAYKDIYPYDPLSPYFPNLKAGDYAGDLKINGSSASYESANYTQDYHIYEDANPSRQYDSGITWQLARVVPFSSFSTNVPRGFPAVANNSYFPSSISKNAGIIINFGANNFTNVDSIEVKISSYSFCYTKVLAANSSSVFFSGNNVAFLSFANLNTANIDVSLKNYSNMVVDSKTFIFMMVTASGVSVNVTP
jgi:hypothetical protein